MGLNLSKRKAMEEPPARIWSKASGLEQEASKEEVIGIQHPSTLQSTTNQTVIAEEPKPHLLPDISEFRTLDQDILRQFQDTMNEMIKLMYQMDNSKEHMMTCNEWLKEQSNTNLRENHQKVDDPLGEAIKMLKANLMLESNVPKS